MLHKKDRTNYVSIQWSLGNADSEGCAVLQRANQVSFTSKLNLSFVVFYTHLKKHMHTTQALFISVTRYYRHGLIEFKQDELLYCTNLHNYTGFISVQGSCWHEVWNPISWWNTSFTSILVVCHSYEILLFIGTVVR